MTVHKLTVAKADMEEVLAVQSYLNELKDVLDENEPYDDEDADVNKEIADVARKYPSRAFIVPLNCGILLDNYQDEESDIIQHPKWIKDMEELFEEMNAYLSENPKNYIGSGSILHNKIIEILKDE